MRHILEPDDRQAIQDIIKTALITLPPSRNRPSRSPEDYDDLIDLVTGMKLLTAPRRETNDDPNQ